ncbi:uncharacterized protein [Symphalangus syndactylus]|uniref:uncharacterized protein n=1 Tax=Symphalangus syndactylus TaxID=9590 RepID=UPI003004132F
MRGATFIRRPNRARPWERSRQLALVEKDFSSFLSPSGDFKAQKAFRGICWPLSNLMPGGPKGCVVQDSSPGKKLGSGLARPGHSEMEEHRPAGSHGLEPGLMYLRMHDSPFQSTVSLTYAVSTLQPPSSPKEKGEREVIVYPCKDSQGNHPFLCEHVLGVFLDEYFYLEQTMGRQDSRGYYGEKMEKIPGFVALRRTSWGKQTLKKRQTGT